MNGQTNLGSIIAQLRRSTGWTQADLAQKLGITAQAVSQWERGETMPDILTLPLLAEVFGCSIDALYKGEEEKAEAPAAASLAVPDDGQWRAVVMCGSRIVEMADLPENIKKSAEKCTVTDRGDIAGVRTKDGRELVIECKDHRVYELAEWIREARREGANAGTLGVVVFHAAGVGLGRMGDQYVLMGLSEICDLIGGING